MSFSFCFTDQQVVFYGGNFKQRRNIRAPYSVFDEKGLHVTDIVFCRHATPQDDVPSAQFLDLTLYFATDSFTDRE